MLLASSCNVHRYVREGDYLHKGSKVKYDKTNKPDSELKSSLKNKCWPSPNKTILGVPTGLVLYSMAKPPTGKGLNYFLQEVVGTPPVLFSKVNINSTINRLIAEAKDNGYLRATANDTILIKRKNARVQYTMHLGERYYVDTVKYKVDSTLFGKAIYSTAAATLLKRETPFTVKTARLERERIDRLMRNKGYFYFIADFILITADTSKPGKIVASVTLKPNIPDSAKQVYTINNLTIYSDYDTENDSVNLLSTAIKYDGFKHADITQRFKPQLFSDLITIKEGDVYQLKYHKRTLTRLVNLNSFKFINATFSIADTITDSLLDMEIYLTPFTRRSMQMEIGAYSKSNNFVGSELKLNVVNRNLFHYADHIDFNISGGFEFQVGGSELQSYTNQNFAAGINYLTPKLWPLKSNFVNNDFVPLKKISFGIEYFVNPSLYTLRSTNVSLGFVWKVKHNWDHALDPIVVNYFYPSNITPEYDSTLNQDPALKKSLEEQFIIGSEYRLNFNNQNTSRSRIHFFNSFAIDVAGNLLNLFGNNFKVEDGQEVIGGIPYAQYLLFSDDIRAYLDINKNLKWVNRAFLGYGFAYKNSEVMPYIKQFFIGGSNSIRAFRSGTLGPGSYSDSTIRSQATQTGEVRIELNTELRLKLMKYLQTAIFVDAGNIWYVNEQPNQPGSGFSKNWYKELAVGTGIGLRIDASVMLIRFDFGFPLRIPYLPTGEQWVVDDVKFGSSGWRKENLILNVAFGFPF